MYEQIPPGCPDPERAYKNIESFLTENPGYADVVQKNREAICLLFSCSQFLANYVIQSPEVLLRSLRELDMPLSADLLSSSLRDLLASSSSTDEAMRLVRNFRKRHFLTITLKDVYHRADPQDVMLDMSNLADAVLSESFRFVEGRLRQRYGTLEDNSAVVIGLGKLGAQELNYSSDVDIIIVYGVEGETSGVPSPQGVTLNKITALEYYGKLVEELTRFLSANTADGFVYRVDLRLRPQGQRGSLALSLRAYEEYYESWGQLWERAALLRARPIAGDMNLGADFLRTVRPFVYRKYLDFDAVEEIRRMKSQVEQLRGDTFSNDIKRGYGGIREIEFFIQVFQLMYGGKEVLLRERGTLRALHRLLQKGLIGYEDFYHLSVDYHFLRTLEHRLQQLNEIQTQTLPTGDKDLEILGRKMGFSGRSDFMEDLRARRLKVRAIYDSLFQPREKPKPTDVREVETAGPLSGVFWDMQTPIEHLLTDELSRTGVRDVRRAIQCLTKIRNTVYSFQTIRGRRVLEEVIPKFVDEALKGVDPDLALTQLVDFFGILSTRESYLEAIAERPTIISNLSFIFSHSEYLSKILMGNPYYVQAFVEDEMREKKVKVSKTALTNLVERYGDTTAIRLLRRLYEVRLGVSFLNGRTDINGLMRSLTRVAEEILGILLERQGRGEAALPYPSKATIPGSGLAVIGFGKLGGRELTFNSDLDIIFLTIEEPTLDEIRSAERILKVLTSYTKDGIAYRADTRLRPDGSKGPLVNSLGGLREYYLNLAHPWEIQALMKARPVKTDAVPARRFMETRREVLARRGDEVMASDLVKMREKILRELSKENRETGAYDIKLGPGGLGELEFTVQFLQLRHCRGHPSLAVQGTRDAVRRLRGAGVLADSVAEGLVSAFEFYRVTETLLRLKNETLLRRGSEASRSLARFMEMDEAGLFHMLDQVRTKVSDTWETVVRD